MENANTLGELKSLKHSDLIGRRALGAEFCMLNLFVLLSLDDFLLMD